MQGRIQDFFQESGVNAPFYSVDALASEGVLWSRYDYATYDC